MREAWAKPVEGSLTKRDDPAPSFPQQGDSSTSAPHVLLLERHYLGLPRLVVDPMAHEPPTDSEALIVASLQRTT